MTNKPLSLAHRRKNSLSVIYCLLIVCGTFSLIHGWFPQLHRLVYICAAIIMLSVILVPEFFRSKIFLWSVFYAAIVYMNHLFGDAYTEDKLILDGLTMISCGCLSYYYLLHDDTKSKRLLIILSLVIVGVDMLGTLLMYMVDPEIVRSDQMIANGGDNESTLPFYRYGMVEYDVLHGLPVLIPPLVMWIRNKKTSFVWKVVSGLALVCLLILLYIGDATTPILLALFAVVVSLLIVQNNHKKSVQRMVVISLLASPFLVSDSFMLGILSSASKVTSGELQKKIEDASAGIKYGGLEGDAGTRYELYEHSFNAFIENPIWGGDDLDKLGGHSALFDRLGSFGLLGSIPWVIVIVLFIRFIYKYIPYRARDYFIVGSFCFVALMILKNMSYFYTWFTFMVLLPCMLTFDVENKK